MCVYLFITSFLELPKWTNGHCSPSTRMMVEKGTSSRQNSQRAKKNNKNTLHHHHESIHFHFVLFTCDNSMWPTLANRFLPIVSSFVRPTQGPVARQRARGRLACAQAIQCASHSTLCAHEHSRRPPYANTESKVIDPALFLQFYFHSAFLAFRLQNGERARRYSSVPFVGRESSTYTHTHSIDFLMYSSNTSNLKLVLKVYMIDLAGCESCIDLSVILPIIFVLVTSSVCYNS